MELLFESRPEIGGTTEKVRFFQRKPEIHPEPVLLRSPDAYVDGAGVTLYGTVLNDGGKLRMWYQGWPRNWNGSNPDFACHAESDDGIEWRKAKLGLVDCGGSDNNLVNLKGHPPSLFIDPDAPPSHRYRATVCTGPAHQGADPRFTKYGFYTAHSADGLRWEYDRHEPQWQSADVITSVYNPNRRQALIAMKYLHRFQGIARRSIWSAEFKDGKWSDQHMALIPDDYDNIRAMAEGYASADYYGMGMMPAGEGMVGFLWNFKHTLPHCLGCESDIAFYGNVDVSLVYQNRSGDCWLHSPGRPDFIHHDDIPWGGCGCVYTACAPVDFGDEQRLYLTKTNRSHGWYCLADKQRTQQAMQTVADEGYGSIGFVKWPKCRLFGFKSDPEGTLTLNIHPNAPCEFKINYECEPQGSIRAELPGVEGFGVEDAMALTGSSLGTRLVWKNGATIPPGENNSGYRTIVLHLNRASVYAYEITPCKQ